MNSTSQTFARAFGDALLRFLQEHGKSQSQAAKEIGLDRARLNTYCKDSKKGVRRLPSADVLYLVCAGLGFEFEYKGCTISANALNQNGKLKTTAPGKQLAFEFERQFSLTDHAGTVSVNLKRPPGRVEVSITLKAIS